MTTAKPRVLFYCQHLLGIGHLTRSLAICAELVNQFEVHFIQGGPDVGRTLTHPDFRLHAISPLMMDEATSDLYDPRGDLSPEALLAVRKEELERIATDFHFDAVITELFPFGRNKLKREILGLLELVKAKNPGARIACSVRDILVEKDDGGERARKSVQLVQSYYDLVYVHSDPEIVRFEETFSETEAIRDKIIYTGFVSETGGKRAQPAQRLPQVLVSQGGGIVGGELLIAAAETARLFPELRFRLVQGPNAPGPLKAALARVMEEVRMGLRPQNVSVEDFVPDFEGELARSALSLSLAGYNTVMNLLSTETPALVLPYKANHEQTLRSKRLEDRGLLRVLEAEDLAPDRLASLMKERLAARPAQLKVNLSGSENTAVDLVKRVRASETSTESEP